MTNIEFSNGYDTLLNSYSGDISIELDEYEKSSFLTQAQEQIVKEIYSNNISSFEVDEETRRQLASLVKTKEFELKDSSDNTLKQKSNKYKHYEQVLPKDCWYIVYEELEDTSENACEDTSVLDIIPVTHDDYHRTIKNPFRGPSGSRALRLDKGDNGIEVEIITTLTNPIYRLRYLKQPKPIILQPMPNEATFSYVDNSEESLIATETSCELPEVLHWNILERAVQLAIASKHLYSNTGK